MSAFQLLAELGRLGVRLKVDGDRLRFSPQSAVTPELVERLKTHKAELIALVSIIGGSVKVWVSEPKGVQVRGEDAGQPDPDPWESGVDPVQVRCPRCGSMRAWQGIGADQWRCVACDPPTKAIKLLALAERIRRERGIASPDGAADMLAQLKQ
ncbi:MAG: hypothetical protein WD468_06520 [Pirellulales bacterium]